MGYSHTKNSLMIKRFKKMKVLYLFLVPCIAYFVIFKYLPMYGVVLAFKDYKMSLGVLHSPWVGLENFKHFFESMYFVRIIRNTLVISFLRLILAFPAPIILALIINEISRAKFKKIIQTITYLPHFISWVVLGGIFITLLSPTRGAVNQIIKILGGKPVYFMALNGWFLVVLISSGMWQSVGWGSIIYLSGIAGINPELYEAAQIDGASRIQKMWRITIPGLTPYIVVLFILNLGRIMDAGFDQVFNMYNSQVYEVADIIDTYVYRVGIVDGDFSYSAAVGLFKNLIGLALVIVSNASIKRVSEYSLW